MPVISATVGYLIARKRYKQKQKQNLEQGDSSPVENKSDFTSTEITPRTPISELDATRSVQELDVPPESWAKGSPQKALFPKESEWSHKASFAKELGLPHQTSYPQELPAGVPQQPQELEARRQRIGPQELPAEVPQKPQELEGPLHGTAPQELPAEVPKEMRD